MNIIPEYGEEVYKGTYFSVYNREQKLYDGSTRTFEKVVRLPAVGSIPIHNGKILIAYQEQPHRPKPYYSHLGGMIEAGEEPLDGIKREFLEETGMIAEQYELYQQYIFPGMLGRSKYIYILRGLQKVQDQMLDPGSERIDVQEVSFEKYIDMMIEGEISERGIREDIMLMKIHGTLDAFKELLFSK